MERRVDWEQRLNAALGAYRRATFAPGKADCVIFSADAIEAQTGVDLAADFRGKYSSEEEWNALIQAAGFADLASLLDDRLPRVSRSTAQRGDLIMVKGGNLAIAWGEVAVGIGEETDTGREGIVRVPREDWRKAWRVG